MKKKALKKQISALQHRIVRMEQQIRELETVNILRQTFHSQEIDELARIQRQKAMLAQA